MRRTLPLLIAFCCSLTLPITSWGQTTTSANRTLQLSNQDVRSTYISARAEDTAPRTANLTLKTPVPASITFNPSSVTGGSSSNATINLSGPAPAGGIELVISSADGVLTVPTSVTVAEGQNTASFVATTTPVAANHVAGISVSRNGVTRTANLTVKAPTPTSLILNPSSLTRGSSSTATLTLSGPAPAEGIEVQLSSANSAAILPASVSVPAGETTIFFNVGTTPVASQTTGSISATYKGVTRSDSLTVKTAVTSSVSLNPTQVGGGAVAVGTVTLTGPAPAGDLIVQLTSSKTTVATVPTSVTVIAGQTYATFAITTFAVTGSQSVTISATVNGVKKSSTLMVAPIALNSISVDSASVKVGDAVAITVTLNGPAPSGGFTVTLTSSNSSVISLPPTISVPGGSASVTVTATASAVGSATLTATANGVSQTVVLTAGP